MKKIILILFILCLGCPILALELQDTSTKTGEPVILQRKIPDSEKQLPEAETKLQKPEEKVEQPPTTKKIAKPKSNKPKYSGLTIYDKPEDKPCNNCYYYYEFSEHKYKKNSYYDRKAMTKEEKAEKMDKIMNSNGSILKKLKGKGKKICK